MEQNTRKPLIINSVNKVNNVNEGVNTQSLDNQRCKHVNTIFAKKVYIRKNQKKIFLHTKTQKCINVVYIVDTTCLHACLHNVYRCLHVYKNKNKQKNTEKEKTGGEEEKKGGWLAFFFHCPLLSCRCSCSWSLFVLFVVGSSGGWLSWIQKQKNGKGKKDIL